jgi:hypothetical protein
LPLVEDVEDQLAAGRGGVDRLGDALEPDLPVGEPGDRLDEVLERAAEAIEAPDDQGVARANVAERLVEADALCFAAGGRVGEDLGAAGLGESILLISTSARLSSCSCRAVARLVGRAVARGSHTTALLQKFEKPQRVVLQAIVRYTTSCGPDGFCNTAACSI